MENDEPLFFNSSSDEENEPKPELTKRDPTTQPIKARKRPTGGHTPLDLATCLKVTTATSIYQIYFIKLIHCPYLC